MQKKAYLSIISAAALWGCIGVFLRLLTAAGLDSMESVAVRSTVAAILYFFWLLFTDRAAVRVRLQDLWYFVGTGIFSVLFFNGATSMPSHSVPCPWPPSCCTPLPSL